MGLKMNQPELINEGAKGSPGLVVAIVANLKQWDSAAIISTLTIIYLVLQILWLLWKWWKAAQSGEANP